MPSSKARWATPQPRAATLNPADLDAVHHLVEAAAASGGPAQYLRLRDAEVVEDHSVVSTPL